MSISVTNNFSQAVAGHAATVTKSADQGQSSGQQLPVIKSQSFEGSNSKAEMYERFKGMNDVNALKDTINNANASLSAAMADAQADAIANVHKDR